MRNRPLSIACMLVVSLLLAGCRGTLEIGIETATLAMTAEVTKLDATSTPVLATSAAPDPTAVPPTWTATSTQEPTTTPPASPTWTPTPPPIAAPPMVMTESSLSHRTI
jgi:hypothetical protein